MNRDWKKLKKSSNGMPTWDSFIPYVLEVLRNGEETTRGVVVDRVLDFLDIPVSLRNEQYSKDASGQNVLNNRIGFALTDLYKANAIIRPKRAVYKITEKGKLLYDKYRDKLTTDILQTQPEYIAYMKELELRNQRSEEKLENSVENDLSDTDLNDEENNQEVVEKIINKKNNEVGIELLDKMRKTDPIFF